MWTTPLPAKSRTPQPNIRFVSLDTPRNIKQKQVWVDGLERKRNNYHTLKAWIVRTIHSIGGGDKELWDTVGKGLTWRWRLHVGWVGPELKVCGVGSIAPPTQGGGRVRGCKYSESCWSMRSDLKKGQFSVRIWVGSAWRSSITTQATERKTRRNRDITARLVSSFAKKKAA